MNTNQYFYIDVFVYDNYHTIGTGTIQSPVRPDDIESKCKQYDFFRYFLDSEKELKEKMIEILEIFND
jgi:hypothetical protein